MHFHVRWQISCLTVKSSKTCEPGMKTHFEPLFSFVSPVEKVTYDIDGVDGWQAFSRVSSLFSPDDCSASYLYRTFSETTEAP